jgi:hypothetical protein
MKVDFDQLQDRPNDDRTPSLHRDPTHAPLRGGERLAKLWTSPSPFAGADP